VVNFWDHLHDGKQAYDSLQVMIQQSTFPNLMDTHPPGLFQIDGNLGAANGMLEALVQSRWMPDAAEIELLPALPQEWTQGSLEGLRVRGGAAINMGWKDGKVESLDLYAAAREAMRIIPPAGQAIARVTTTAGRTIPLSSDGMIQLESDTSYRVTFR
jgi:alpha-L-fucosidase 2